MTDQKEMEVNDIENIIESWGLGPEDGMAVKCIALHRHKNHPAESIQELEKAMICLQKRLNQLGVAW